MNQRDMKNFLNIRSVLNKKQEEDLDMCYMEDMAEDIKNK